MRKDEKTAAISALITLVLFVILIIVLCATVIPTLYDIEDNTAQLNPGGEAIYWLKVLHDDLLIMQGQLNAAAGLLVSINDTVTNIDEDLS